MDIKEILKKVQSLQRRIMHSNVTMTIDYSINDDGRGSIDVFIHSNGVHCERFCFPSYPNYDEQMFFLKEYLKEIEAFKDV